MITALKQSPKSVKVTIAALSVVALFGIAYSAWLSMKVSRIEDPQALGEEEVKDVVDAVGKYMVLPDGETPTLATVSDPEKLKDQAFFANAEIGDKVLIYSTARKAVLWRPSSKKIIEVSALTVNPAP